MIKIVSSISESNDIIVVRVQYHSIYFDVKVRFLGYKSDSIILIHQTLSNNMHNLSCNHGWWSEIVGYGKVLDLNMYQVIIISKIDIIVNTTINNFFQIAQIEDVILTYFGINQIYINIGASFGAAGALSIATISDKLINKTVVISFTHKSYMFQTLYRNIILQILKNSIDMDLAVKQIQKLNVIFFRTPYSWNHVNVVPEYYLNELSQKLPNVSSKNYMKMIEMMNNFMLNNSMLSSINSSIHLVYSSSDNMYLFEHIQEFHNILINLNKKTFIYKLLSDKGHDAFLLEQNKLSKILYDVIRQN